jgi:hypothetical protein
VSSEQKNRTHVTETPDTSHIKNIDVTHETSDVQVGGIAKFIVGLLILTIATFIGLWGMFLAFQKTETQKEQQRHRSPIAMTGEERLPPEPRLQSAPGFAESLEQTRHEKETEPRSQTAGESFPKPKDALWEINALRAQWNDVLEHGPVDQNGQRYGMPIEQAKEEALKQLAEKGQTADGRKQ